MVELNAIRIFLLSKMIIFHDFFMTLIKILNFHDFSRPGIYIFKFHDFLGFT
jgi:hypothetical protein